MKKTKKGSYRGKVAVGWGKPSRPTPRRGGRRVGAAARWPVYSKGWCGWRPFVAWSEGGRGADGQEDADEGVRRLE